MLHYPQSKEEARERLRAIKQGIDPDPRERDYLADNADDTDYQPATGEAPEVRARGGVFHLGDVIDKIDQLALIISLSSKQTFTTREAALYFGVSEGWIRKQCARKTIPHYKRGKLLSFDRRELEDWLKGERIKTKQEADAEASLLLAKRRFSQEFKPKEYKQSK